MELKNFLCLLLSPPALASRIFFILFFLKQRLVTLAPDIDFLSSNWLTVLFLSHSLTLTSFIALIWSAIHPSPLYVPVIFFIIQSFFVMAVKKINALNLLSNRSSKTMSRRCFGVFTSLKANAITQFNYPNEISAPTEKFQPSTKTKKLFSTKTSHDLIFCSATEKCFRSCAHAPGNKNWDNWEAKINRCSTKEKEGKFPFITRFSASI